MGSRSPNNSSCLSETSNRRFHYKTSANVQRNGQWFTGIIRDGQQVHYILPVFTDVRRPPGRHGARPEREDTSKNDGNREIGGPKSHLSREQHSAFTMGGRNLSISKS